MDDRIGFLRAPEPTPEAERGFEEDLAELGYVMNVSRLWAYQPATVAGLSDLLRLSYAGDPLSLRQRQILIAACAAAFGDSYCALVWGGKLAKASDVSTAVGVLRGLDAGLSVGERAMARWARAVAWDPNAVRTADVEELREAGFSDAQIFSITVFVALRLAFATVNDALGVRPDAGLRHTLPAPVLDAVTLGRPIEDDPAHE
jgi:uncharacterized peroxidase-related enzyme